MYFFILRFILKCQTPDLAPIVLIFLEAEDYEKAETVLSVNQIGIEDQKYFCQYWQKSLPADSSSENLHLFYKSHRCS